MGVDLISTLSRKNGANFPIALGEDIIGAFVTVASTGARDAIPTAILRTGAIVRIGATSSYYEWNGSAWVSVSFGGGGGGSGDVVGPASATDGRFALFDGPTGKLLEVSAYTPASLLAAADTAANAGDAAVTALIPTAGGAPANVTKAAAAAGAAATFSRSDHKHDVTTAAPSAVNLAGVSAAEGASTSLARADHTHSITGVIPRANGGATPVAQGPDLTNANQTINVSDGSEFTMLASTTTTTRSKTLGTSGTPKTGEALTFYIYAQGHNVAFINGGTLGNTLITVAAGEKLELTFEYDGANWGFPTIRRLP